MSKRYKELKQMSCENSNKVKESITRRRMLQIGAAGIALGSLGTVTASLGSDELSDTIIIDGSGSSEPVPYEFFTTGSIALHPDIGENDTLGNDGSGHMTGEVDGNIHAYQFSGELSYLDVNGTAEVRLLYGDSSRTDLDRIEIVSSSDGEVDYEFITSGPVAKVTDIGDRSADSDDTITQTDDGTWLVDGSTQNGYGDTYDFEGDIEQFNPVTGEFTLFINGEETTVTELTGQEIPEDDEEPEIDREHWYSFEATGEEYADYYLEVEDGGDMIASTVDDAIVEPDFHWINDDGTKAAGRVQPGDTHAYAFDTLVADVTIDGEAHATVDDSDSNLEYYPRESASGDHWKGYFPWHIEGEERTHWYSFEATGDEYADYYIEVEDGGDMIPSLVNDAVIEYEYFWIGDEGTKAAGRVQPGDTHAYAFDTLVADVTIEGEAHAIVDGSDSNVDGDYYPREMASGDYWKTGFPWQDDDHEAPGTDGHSSVIGGGPGYERSVTSDQADYLVQSKDELASALSSASSGEVVFVDGDATIDMGSSSYTLNSGVTLASDRGVDGSEGGLIATSQEPTQLFVLESNTRFTGLRVRGSSPGSTDGSSSSARAISVDGDDVEVDNCDIWGFPYAGIRFSGGDGHVHHNVIRECNKSGLGYGVSMSSGNPVIEYNYFDFNRHSVATNGEHYGYICRYNHFGPRLTSHAIDMHDPAGVRYEVHNNVVEGYIGEDGDQRSGVALRGVPDDVALIVDNWFWNPDPPASEPDGWSTRQAIIQVGTDTWQGISFSDNEYGSDADTTFGDIIPEYDGSRS